jgi:cyclopropane fatty-acyl-phospholipid synthase-like methyltransferase
MPYKETKNYYNKYANLIDKHFPQGYQYSLIFNEKYSNLPLSDQNNFFLTELAELNSSMSILDMGCGNGQFYDFLKKNYNCEYYGIDLSENQIKNCKEKYNQNIFECVDMHSFRSNKKYDVCYLIESIGYSNNILSLVENIYSLLKPNGQVIIRTSCSHVSVWLPI